MKVLYWPQLSMRSYQDNRWLLAEDSQANKMRAWMDYLPEEWEWTWLLPFTNECATLPRPMPGYLEIPWSPNVLTDRFGFPMPEIVEILGWDDYDFAIVEAIEHVAGFRAAQDFVGKRFPVVGMIGLYDDRDAQFYLRQIEGALRSDYLLFPLEVIAERWFERARTMVHELPMEYEQTYDVFPAIFDSREVKSYRPSNGKSEELPTVFFISRLSDGKRTRYEEFFEAVDRLLEEGHRFRLVVANPNEAMTPDQVRSRLQHPMLRVGPFSRAQYLDELWRADIVPVLYSLDDGYSVGACEAMAARCLIVQMPEDGNLARDLGFALGTLSSDFHMDALDKQEEWAESQRGIRNLDGFRDTIERLVIA